MHHAHLTNRYLTTRVIPLIAVAAVALCVALVIIVVSVMTGFLDMVKNSGRTLMGDVVVSYPLAGIPYYERLIERIEALPEAAAATPVVDGFGLLKMPYPAGERKQTREVQVWGIDAESFARVTGEDGYPGTLYWRPPSAEDLEEMGEHDFRRILMENEGLLERTLDEGLRLEHPAAGENSAVLGMHVSIGNERQRDGSYTPVGPWWMPGHEVWLTVVPIGQKGAILNPESEQLKVVNEFNSGVFLIDERRIVIPISVAQKMFHLNEAMEVDDEFEETGFEDPARATMVLVRAADGVEPDDLRAAVERAYVDFQGELFDESQARLISENTVPPTYGFNVQALTWRQQQKQFIDPVEKERELMRVLFSIIYLVCAGLVLSIFWAIVYEKTRDIGILRSIGGSRLGIGYIFLRYGAIIGVAGAIVGLGLAHVVVRNINAIHAAMGEQVPVVVWFSMLPVAIVMLAMIVWRTRSRLLMPFVLWSTIYAATFAAATGMMLHVGLTIWDPSVYYFSTIPNEVDHLTAITTMIGAVVFSVLGAFLPAARAADTDPVKALRYD